MPKWLNLPNVLTLTRLILVPFVIRAILGRQHTQALTLFGCAAITDLIDGALARRYSLVTSTGAYLDPIADKALLGGVYLALALIASIPWWFVGLIFARDLLILSSSGILMLVTPVRDFSPSIWGKVNTFLQIATAVAWMAKNASPGTALDLFAALLIWPTAALTIWSGIHYGWRGLKAVRMH